MDNSVIIKGTKSGLILVLDKSLSFTELKEKIKEKLKASAGFLGDASLALSFEGRALTDDEKRQVLDLFSETTDLNIVCLVETDEKKEAVMEKALSQKLMELNANTGQFYKGNLRSGQKLEFDTSVILLGDVNPGASIISKGNIVILGSFKGKAHAGAAGNTNAFVLALDMQPVQIMIADVRARCSDEPKKPEKKPMKNTQIAYLEKGSLYIEDLSREVLNDILL